MEPDGGEGAYLNEREFPVATLVKSLISCLDHWQSYSNALQRQTPLRCCELILAWWYVHVSDLPSSPMHRCTYHSCVTFIYHSGVAFIYRSCVAPPHSFIIQAFSPPFSPTCRLFTANLRKPLLALAPLLLVRL